MDHAKIDLLCWLVVLLWASLPPAAISAATSLELIGETDAPALLRIPIPPGEMAIQPGHTLTLTDERGRQVMGQVDFSGLDRAGLELILIRPSGLGQKLRVVLGEARADDAGFSAETEKGKIVSLNASDRLIARYQLGTREVTGHPQHACAAFFHPMVTPAGVIVTDDAPADHLHHRGLFLGFTKVQWTGHDRTIEGSFWVFDGTARIAEGTLHYARNGPVCATLGASHDYVIGNQVVLKQQVIARATRLTPRVNVLDLEVHVIAEAGEIELGANFFNGLQLRGASSYKKDEQVFTYADGRPHLDVNEHKEDPPYDRWIDQTAPVAGRLAGTTIVIHPDSPKSRLCYARRVKGVNLNFLYDAPVKLAEGESLYCRYQIYMHDGDTVDAEIPGIAAWFNPGFQARWNLDGEKPEPGRMP